MKAFKYSLEHVLEYRKNNEESTKHGFAVAQKKHLDEKVKLEDLEKKLKKVLSTCEKVAHQNILAQKNFHHYVQFLREKILLQGQLTLEYEKELNEKRKILIRAQQDRETVEKLKKKEFERYQLESNQLEQKMNDEFALYAYLRK